MSSVTYTVWLYPNSAYQPPGWVRLPSCDSDGLDLALRRTRSASLLFPGAMVRVMSDMSHTPFAVYLAGREVRCPDVG